MNGDIVVMIERLGPENIAGYRERALATYLGESCIFCGKTYLVLSDLADVTYVGRQEKGCLACTACWQANLRKALDQLSAYLAELNKRNNASIDRLVAALRKGMPSVQDLMTSIRILGQGFAQFNSAVTRGRRPPRPSRASAWKRGRDRQSRHGSKHA